MTEPGRTSMPEPVVEVSRVHRVLARVARLGVLFVVTVMAPLTVMAEDVLDEPIVMVADRVILRSEWQAQVSLFAMQTKRDVNDPRIQDSIGPRILEQMINDELILIQAERDTIITVTPEEIDHALQEHIQGLRDQFADEDEFQKELTREGLSERDLRVRYRREVRNQILKQKLIQRKLGDVAISNGEVKSFFHQYKDSLPAQPEGIKLAHILLPVESSSATVDSSREQITRILKEIQGGLDFATAATRYSQDATSSGGGDLGWFGKGDMVPPFETAAFALTPNQISGVVRTRYGFHLIQCLEKSGDRVHARHILISLAPTPADSALVMARADSIAQAARGGADFCQLAQVNSQDAETQKNCGELGWYPVAEMFPEFKAVLANAGVGSIIGPVSTKFGWHVLRVLDRRASHAFDLTSDWDAIKDMARREKTNRVVADWIAEIRKDTYVDVRPLSGRTTVSQ